MREDNRRRLIGRLINRSEHSLEAAKILQERGIYLEAISRAYFAAFYLAKAVLATKDISRIKHSGVLSAFGKHFIKEKAHLSQLGDKLGYPGLLAQAEEKVCLR